MGRSWHRLVREQNALPFKQRLRTEQNGPAGARVCVRASWADHMGAVCCCFLALTACAFGTGLCRAVRYMGAWDCRDCDSAFHWNKRDYCTRYRYIERRVGLKFVRDGRRHLRF